MKATIILTALTAVVSCMRAPSVCLSNIIELDAGVSFVSASIDGPITQRCEASVTFDDTEFLPLTYTFDASHCDGSFLASFQVPHGLSAGDGYIFWQCSGQFPTCNRIRVKGGQRDPSLALQMQGSVQCAAKVSHVPSMTTRTRQSSTGSPGTSMGTGGGKLPETSGKNAAPTQSALPTDGASSVTALSAGVWPTGAPYTGAITGTSPNISTSATPAINDASAISAYQTAITSTILTTILLTQTITTIATVC